MPVTDKAHIGIHGGQARTATSTLYSSLMHFFGYIPPKAVEDDSISTESITIMDESIENFKALRVSAPIDLSDF